jgi:hypothetical protein
MVTSPVYKPVGVQASQMTVEYLGSQSINTWLTNRYIAQLHRAIEYLVSGAVLNRLDVNLHSEQVPDQTSLLRRRNSVVDTVLDWFLTDLHWIMT